MGKPSRMTGPRYPVPDFVWHIAEEAGEPDPFGVLTIKRTAGRVRHRQDA